MLNRYAHFLGFALAAAFATLCIFEASTQNFSTRAVRDIMPLPAGSETDVFARTLARCAGGLTAIYTRHESKV